MKENRILFVLVILITFFGCEVESVDYPDTPSVEFKNVNVQEGEDLLGNKTRDILLHFYLIDGDGDIAPFEYTNPKRNCHWELHYFDNNIRKKDTLINDTTEWVNMPYVGDLGQDNSLKADVYIEIQFTLPPQTTYDSLQFNVQVFDLNLNASNIAWSDTIVVDR